MQPLSSNEATRRSQTFRFLGSFWTRLFQNKQQLRALMHLNYCTQLLGDFQAAVASSQHDDLNGMLVSQRSYRFKHDDVVDTGMALYDDPDLPATYDAAQPADLAYGLYRIKYFVLPVVDVIPFRIQTKTGTLLLGVDFFVSDQKWIFFRQDPRQLFPEGIFTIGQGRDLQHVPLHHFFMGGKPSNHPDILRDWLRKFQTPNQFKLALADAGGFAIVRQGGRLRQRHELPLGNVSYVFENEVVNVKYEHAALVPGQVYVPGTIVGDGFQIYHQDDRERAWWRQVDWRGGISLDPIMPAFKGMHLPDANVPAYRADAEIDSRMGSQVHARLDLGNPVDLELSFWEWVGQRENASGVYLNRYFGFGEDPVSQGASLNDNYAQLMTNYREAVTFDRQLGQETGRPDFAVLPDSKRVNALDTFFALGLAGTTMVMVVYPQRVPDWAGFVAFLRQEMFAGAANLILSRMEQDPTETVDLSVQDQVVLQASAPVALDQIQVDAADLVHDRVLLQQIVPS